MLAACVHRWHTGVEAAAKQIGTVIESPHWRSGVSALLPDRPASARLGLLALTGTSGSESGQGGSGQARNAKGAVESDSAHRIPRFVT